MNLKSLLVSPKGTPFDLTVLISSIEDATSANGKPYLFITFTDSSATLKVAQFDFVDKIKAKYKSPNVVLIRGEMDFYTKNGETRPSPKLAGFKLIEEVPSDPSLFLPSYDFRQAAHSLCHMMASLEKPWYLLAKIAFDFPDEILSMKPDEFVENDSRVMWKKFCTAPAAMIHHQNLIGGLCVHTAGVVGNLQAQLDVYCRQGHSRFGVIDLSDKVNKSRLLFTGLVHDYCKMFDYVYETHIGWNPETKVDHRLDIITKVELWNYQLSEENRLDREQMQILKYNLLSHHGPFTEQVPKTLEGWMLFLADTLDGKMYEEFEGKMK